MPITSINASYSACDPRSVDCLRFDGDGPLGESPAMTNMANWSLSCEYGARSHFRLRNEPRLRSASASGPLNRIPSGRVTWRPGGRATGAGDDVDGARAPEVRAGHSNAHRRGWLDSSQDHEKRGSDARRRPTVPSNRASAAVGTVGAPCRLNRPYLTLRIPSTCWRPRGRTASIKERTPTSVSDQTSRRTPWTPDERR
jgi:hypothetical protein